MRALTLTGAIALVALAGACTKPTHVDGLAEPITPAPSATSPSTSAATTTAKATGNATDPCPVSAATLHSALRTSEINDRAGKPDGLAKPACYQGFAYARSTFRKTPEGEIPWILFKFDTKTRHWQALNLGTGDVCAGYASQAVRDRLNRGTGGGC
jgi:hypothetical protein